MAAFCIIFVARINNATMKITLRKRPISNGARQSLLLDFSPPLQHPATDKNIRFHTLGLYLVTRPKTSNERKENRETLFLAESIRSRIYSRVLAGDLSFLGGAPSTDLIEYMQTEQSKRKPQTAQSWASVIKYLKEYAGGPVALSAVDKSFLESIRADLLHNYAQNTAAHYFSTIRAALNAAYRDGLIQEKVTEKVRGVATSTTHRAYLTSDEVTALYHAHCESPALKTAFLFSVVTGLRFSDIARLKDDNITATEEGKALHYRQQKTGKLQYHPISEQAYGILRQRFCSMDRNGLLFPGLKNLVYTPRNYLGTWVAAAGIRKHVTFHTARHTYAVLHLANGTSMEVLRDMMGHTDLKTTQIYGQIVNEARRRASENVRIST